MSPPTAPPVCSSTATTTRNQARQSFSSLRETAKSVVNFTNQTTMSNERFTLTPSANSMWTVSDKETGFSITFREGLFNETQEVHKPEQLPTIPEGMEPAVWGAKAMSAIGDFMALEHPHIAMCDIESRRMAIWMLSNEKYWITMAAACNSLLIDFDGNEGQYLMIEISDYLELSGENPAGLTDNERVNLLGSLSMLDDDMANEVFNILLTFWHEYTDANVSIDTWARDLLWWPAWANHIITEEEQQEIDEENGEA